WRAPLQGLRGLPYIRVLLSCLATPYGMSAWASTGCVLSLPWNSFERETLNRIFSKTRRTLRKFSKTSSENILTSGSGSTAGGIRGRAESHPCMIFREAENEKNCERIS